MNKTWAILVGLLSIPLCSIGNTKEIHQCNIKGSVVFQYHPCPDKIKTYEQVFRVNSNDIQGKKSAALKADEEYQERLKLSAAKRGDLVIVPKHKHIAVDQLKASTKSMAFNECKNYIKNAQLSSPPNFKTSVITDTKSENLIRICKKNGSIILACSESNHQLVISESAHCPLK